MVPESAGLLLAGSLAQAFFRFGEAMQEHAFPRQN